MSVREDIVQGLRDFFKAAASLTDEQVIPADDKGPRPTSAYLTIKVLSVETIGDDEILQEDVVGVQKQFIRGQRTASVSVQAFGSTAMDWCEDIWLTAQADDSVMAVLDDAGLSIRVETLVSDISRLVDTRIEPRGLWEFDVDFEVESTRVTIIEAVNVIVDATFTSPVSSDLTLHIVAS